MPFSHAQATASNNPILSDVANSYSFDEVYFNDFVAPDLINNGEISGQIPIWDTESRRAEVSDLHTDGKTSNIVELASPSYQSYYLEAFSLSFKQSEFEDRQMRQGGWNPEEVKMGRVRSLIKKLKISENIALYTLVGTSGNYDSSVVTAAGTAWSSDAADPISNIKNNIIAQEALRGFRPRYGVINSKTFDYLRHHVNVTSRLSSDKDKVASIEEIAMLAGLDSILVTDAKKDTSKPEGTAANTWIWGNTMVLFTRPENVTPAALQDGAPIFAATIRSDNRSYNVVTHDKSELSNIENGYYYVHEVKAGFRAQKFITVNDSSNLQPVAGGIITGLY